MDVVDLLVSECAGLGVGSRDRSIDRERRIESLENMK